MPNAQLACSVCYWRLVFVEIMIKPQIFHASVGKFQLSRLWFSVRNFQHFIFNYLLFALKFCAKNFKFLLFRFLLVDSNFHVSAFQVSVSKFQFSSVGFSGFNFSSFCRQVPIFTLLLVNFLRKQMLIFWLFSSA